MTPIARPLREPLAFAESDTLLRDDVRRLGTMVGDMLAEQVSEAFLQQVEAVRRIAIEALKIAHAGLRRRAKADACGTDESGFLEPLMDIADANETPAERKLALFHGEWNGSVDPVFREFAY